jgi:hypothetical protein
LVQPLIIPQYQTHGLEQDNNGDPLTILRNSQYDDGKDAWIPQVEDINKEGSSVYMTSTQAIPIEVSSKSYSSYKTAPTSPDKFAGEQIILNSGRLLFNTKAGFNFNEF